MRVRSAVSVMKPYVPGKPVEEVQRELGLTGLVKLNQNENPLGPSAKALEAAAQALRQIGHTYAEGTARALRAKIAELWGLPAEDWVIAGNGSDEIFRLLAETYLEPGDRVVVPAPSFSYYKFVADLMGAVSVAVPLRDQTMDLVSMANAAQNAKIVFLCRPNNPTGAVFGEEAFSRFMAEVPSTCLVVLDEAYREFDETNFDSRTYVLQYPNLIVTRTFSKIYGMAGFRLGYGVAQPGLLKPFFTIRDPFSINVAAMAAGVAALDDREHLLRTVTMVREGKQQLYRLFEQLGLRYAPSQTNFVLVDCGRPAQEVYEALLRNGVLVRPCGSFGLPNAIRVTVGTPEQNGEFTRALQAFFA